MSCLASVVPRACQAIGVVGRAKLRQTKLSILRHESTDDGKGGDRLVANLSFHASDSTLQRQISYSPECVWSKIPLQTAAALGQKQLAHALHNVWAVDHYMLEQLGHG